MYFTLEDDGDLMYVKYYLTKDADGNKIDSWQHEIWKRVTMPDTYPSNIVR